MPRPSKLAHLDVIRGLAAFVVVVNHIHAGFYIRDAAFGFSDLVGWLINPVHTLFFGEFAVYLFFVLSGFVLSLGYFQTFEPLQVVKLGLKRLPRLWIPVFVTSLMYWLVLKMGWIYSKGVVDINHFEWLDNFWNHQYSFPAFLGKVTNDLFIHNDRDFCLNINSSLWTMPIELKYSYMLFGMLLFIRGLKSLVAIIFLVLGSFFIPDHRFYLFAFGLGLTIAYSFVHLNKNIPNWMSCACLVLAFVLGTNLFGRFWGNAFFFCLAAGAVLISVSFNPAWASAVTKKALVYLGKISFSLYLIHLLVLGSLGSWIYIYLIRACHWSYETVYGVVFGATILMSILTATVIYYAIEKPSLRFAAWFSDWVLSKTTQKFS